MKFKRPLYSGIFLRRYKRFFAEIDYNGRKITCHCPNTGSMKNLLKEKNKVYFSESDNPKRKLNYTLEIIKSYGTLVGINTLKTNFIASELLNTKSFMKKYNYDEILPEKKINEETRLDFCLMKKGLIIGFVEVKNVTLVRNIYARKKLRIAEFPDSITSRGSKHMNKLINLKRTGFLCIMLYIVQRNDCEVFKIAKDIDLKYAQSYKKAQKSDIKILAYNCIISNKSINIKNKIKVEQL